MLVFFAEGAEAVEFDIFDTTLSLSHSDSKLAERL